MPVHDLSNASSQTSPGTNWGISAGRISKHAGTPANPPGSSPCNVGVARDREPSGGATLSMFFGWVGTIFDPDNSANGQGNARSRPESWRNDRRAGLADLSRARRALGAREIPRSENREFDDLAPFHAARHSLGLAQDFLRTRRPMTYANVIVETHGRVGLIRLN